MSAARLRKARVSREDCVSCGACAKVCPKGAIAVCHGLYAKVDEERCIGCGRCANECPAGIISLTETER
ncbi:MAG: 4Fe-4S binding protein [Pyramidobacter sp.]|nr:4Fe-4S binding protein [Pyramidobacter sp.]